jgi:DNA recombination protein RmuC
MEIVLLVIGLLVGGLAGYLFAASRSKPVTDPGLAASLAAASAKVEVLERQVSQQEAARLAREAKDREEARLLEAIAPVRENLAKMQQAVANMETQRAQQVATLNETIRQSLESDEYLRRQTQQLSNALSSNSVRGVWGEAQLRRLVELAGLLKHADFDEQATITTGRADMIINLPGGKQLAIDSKVPYNSYQEASQISDLAEGNDKARKEALLQEHVKAVRKHINDLASRSYWSSLDASPDFVICFIPSESLLAASLDADPTLLDEAFKKNVAIASPVSLFSVLKTINYIWRQNVDENQVRAMIRVGQELYERVGKVAELADKLGRSILGSVNAYNAFVSSFESRFLVTARRLNNLDENQLATSTIDSPRQLEESPKPMTAAEAASPVDNDSENTH